jgi:hypothetical protein
VADKLSNPRPWHPAQVQERDPPARELVGERREADGALWVVLEARLPDGGDDVGECVFVVVVSEGGAHRPELVSKSSRGECFDVDSLELEAPIQHRVAFTENMVARSLVVLAIGAELAALRHELS